MMRSMIIVLIFLATRHFFDRIGISSFQINDRVVLCQLERIGQIDVECVLVYNGITQIGEKLSKKLISKTNLLNRHIVQLFKQLETLL